MLRGTRVLLILGIAVAAGCGGEGPTNPGTAPRFEGAYRLSITASTSCTGLPVSAYAWDVTMTSSGSGPNDSAKAVLAGTSLDFSFWYRFTATPDELFGVLYVLGDNITIAGTPLFFGPYSLNATARVTEAGNGRAQITNGTLDGEILITDDPAAIAKVTPVARCNAANHRFSLIPR